MRRDLRARLGERVRALRQARGWTQEDLGERAAISYKFVGQIERGDGNPTIETLQRLTRALDVDVTELFGWSAPLARETEYTLTADELTQVREALGSANGILEQLVKPRRSQKKRS